MKILFSITMEKTVLIMALVLLTIGAPSAFASTDLPSAKDPQAGYQSGYSHGLTDRKNSCRHDDGCHWYILEPGHGFGFHTQEFNQGYIAAMCKAGISSDADEATWSCPR